MSHKKRNTLALCAVFFTFFMDWLSWAIIFPIFAPYFLDPSNQIFSPEVLLSTRTTLLGIFLMAFSLGQFLGSPVLGEYADRHGRKKTLVLSIFCTFIGMGLTAWSMQVGQLWLLFLSRLIVGVFSSNMSVCLACITDLSHDEKSKAKHFGTLSVLVGLAFVFGSLAAGKLSDPAINSAFSFTFPLWLATALTFVNLLFILVSFRETAKIDPQARFNWLDSIYHLQQALKTKKIKRIYSVYFLFLFAWTLLFQFTPVLVVEKFGFTSSDIGNLAVYMGIFWGIGSGILNRALLHRFSRFSILEICLLGFTILCGLIIIPKHLLSTVAILGGCVLFSSLAWPICTGIISSLASRQIQGKILGMSQSVQSLAMAIAPVVGGIAYSVMAGLPFLIAAGASLIASVIYFITVRTRTYE